MKKYGRILAVLMALAMLLTACSSGSSSSGGGSSASSGGSSSGAGSSGSTASSSGSSSSTASSASSSSGAGSSSVSVPDDIGFVEGETLTLVIPGSTGGGSDLGIRYYGQAITDTYGITTTFENYTNTIGHQTVADAEPDGTTLTVATGALNIQWITGQATVDPMNDFTLIACLQDNGFSCLAVPADAPYDTFADFVEYAKAHPGELNVGMPSSGSNTMLFGMLQNKLDIQLNPVECANESDRLTNLAGGFIDIGIVGVGNALEYEDAGMLKVIGTCASNGITIDQYPEELPERYKTLQEQGYEDLYFNVYHYLLGPAGMDETQVQNMNAAMEKIVDVCRDDIAGIGNVPGWHNLEESKEIRQQEYDDLVEIARNMGILVNE